MKKLILLTAVLITGLSATGQEVPKQVAPASNTKTTLQPESYVMKGGKVWLVKEGTTVLLEKEININATVVKPNGTVILKDGTTTVMQDGDMVNASGALVMASKRETPVDEQTHDK
jgi:hypothetical protein